MHPHNRNLWTNSGFLFKIHLKNSYSLAQRGPLDYALRLGNVEAVRLLLSVPEVIAGVRETEDVCTL